MQLTETPTDQQFGVLDVAWARAQFPSLATKVNGRPAVFLDGPGGTQVPRQVIEAITNYLATSNANTGGAYLTSRQTDAMIAATRAAMADFLGCGPSEVVLGPNMTTLTVMLSRAIGREINPGDEVVVTNLDHDANVSSWKFLEERGAVIRTVDIHEEDCTLDLEDLARKVNHRTRLVAVGYASNAVGTVNDVRQIVRVAHAAGALAFIDAVHYAPHGFVDVRDLDCDFLACSPYKFFGPHQGVLYGKREHLDRLQAYKLRPATNASPDRWELGTLSHECLAGVIAAVDYIAELGRRAGGQGSRRDLLRAAYRAIGRHERDLAKALVTGLLQIPRLRLYGIADEARFGQRVPTMAVRIEGHTPLELAKKLGEHGIFTWDGNYYAIAVTERMGVESSGGFLRIGAVHYNTIEEIARTIEELSALVG
jgi:cysteine desulfurase family protein (TIGR01976 family)